MTLAEFVAEEHARADRFLAWYKVEMASPENVVDGDPMFPAEMDPGEWDQQMMAFSDGECVCDE
jgi:hypothetical protein